MFVCKYCKDDSSLHAFRIHQDSDTHTTYYSCIANSTDKNVEQIVYHINGYLEWHHQSNKTWSWIIDSTNFCMEWHTFSLTMELINLYQTYYKTLTEIKVIHLNGWMRGLVDMCIPFMSNELQAIIKME